MTWFLLPHNLPFAIAFGVVLLFAVVEILGMLSGFSLAAGQGDADAGSAVDGDADGDGWLAWVLPGDLPFLIRVNFLLAAFAAMGLTLQACAARWLPGGALSPWVAALVAGGIAIPITRQMCRLLDRLWPGDESSAVTRQDLVGLSGVVTIGCATHSRAAETKLRGPKGDTHYALCFALRPGEEFPQGSHIILAQLHPTLAGQYLAIRDEAGPSVASAIAPGD